MDKNFLKLIPLSLLAILTVSSCTKNEAPTQTNNSIRNRVYASEAEEAKALLLSVEELRQMPKEIRIKRAAALALKNYAFYKDSVFYLNISKEDAKKLGVDEDLYEEIIEGIKDTNKQIKECNAKGEKVIIDTTEVKDTEIEKKQDSSSSSIKTSKYQGINRRRGTIITYNSREGEDAAKTSYHDRYVEFMCRSHYAISPAFICKTYIFGGWHIEKRFGVLWQNRRIKVKLAACGSNYYARIFFSTTDSGGGTAQWSVQ